MPGGGGGVASRGVPLSQSTALSGPWCGAPFFTIGNSSLSSMEHEIGTSRRRDTEVRLTHRWREPDSNHRSRSCERHFWASPIGDDGGATYRFRPETTMLAWSGSP